MRLDQAPTSKALHHALGSSANFQGAAPCAWIKRQLPRRRPCAWIKCWLPFVAARLIAKLVHVQAVRAALDQRQRAALRRCNAPAHAVATQRGHGTHLREKQKMPPLLAALLMIEFSCDLRIVQALDLGVEWRRYDALTAKTYSRSWFQGWLGSLSTDVIRGTYTWPCPFQSRRFSKR